MGPVWAERGVLTLRTSSDQLTELTEGRIEERASRPIPVSVSSTSILHVGDVVIHDGAALRIVTST